MGRTEIRLSPTDGSFEASLNGHHVSQADVSSGEVSVFASMLATYASVRSYLLSHQRDIASQGGVVMDGRDIGSVVVPYAELKVYMYACVEVRAARRWQERNGEAPYAETLYAIQERDASDRHRAHRPLVCASDARHLDTTWMDISEQVHCIVSWAEALGERRGIKK